MYRRPQLAKLDATKATAIDLIAVGGTRTFCPNDRPVQLKAVVTLADHRQVSTWQAGQSQEGRLGFNAFEWTSTLGMVDQSGYLRVPSDPFAVVDRTVTVTARVVGRPKLSSQVELTPTWDCGAVADARGDAGMSGAGGWSGQAGQVGRSGDSSTQATDGQPGDNGQSGGDGGPGGPAPTVDVSLAWVKTAAGTRLEVAVVGRAVYLFDPRGHKLTVVVDGGGGGTGGSGGAGGSGGSGGSNNIEGGGDGGNGGDGGDGGHGGRGGDGGDGGLIRVRYDAHHPELLDGVVYSNAGGPGGSGGRGGYGGSAGIGGSSASGRRGTDGRRGQPGQDGAPGRQGRQGPPADVQPADVRQLFGREIQAGWPIELTADVLGPAPH